MERELGIGVRTPEGVWDWIGRKRRELESLVIELPNREVFDYFRGEAIVKDHTLNNIIVQHCLSIDFISKVENSEAETSHDDFALFLSKIDEFLDTDAPGGKFGSSDVYDATKTNRANIGKGPPGSRGEIAIETIIPVIGKVFR